MKISLIFYTWTKGGKSVRFTHEGIELSMGQFHGGTTFDGTIDLDQEDAEELCDALQRGFRPVFTVACRNTIRAQIS